MNGRENWVNKKLGSKIIDLVRVTSQHSDVTRFEVVALMPSEHQNENRTFDLLKLAFFIS